MRRASRPCPPAIARAVRNANSHRHIPSRPVAVIPIAIASIMRGTATASRKPAATHFGTRLALADAVLARVVQPALVGAGPWKPALGRKQRLVAARIRPRRLPPRGPEARAIFKSASDSMAALPIKRPSTYREGGTLGVPFQDQDHGMTMERRTMIF